MIRGKEKGIEMDIDRRESTLRQLLVDAWWGMRLICPSCRRGRIYRSLTEMNPECPHCGVTFEREEGDFLGAMLIAYSITAVVVAAGIYAVSLLTDLSTTAHLVLWIVFGTLFLLFTYRNMKGIWIGILYAMNGLHRG